MNLFVMNTSNIQFTILIVRIVLCFNQQIFTNMACALVAHLTNYLTALYWRADRYLGINTKNKRRKQNEINKTTRNIF